MAYEREISEHMLMEKTLPFGRATQAEFSCLADDWLNEIAAWSFDVIRTLTALSAKMERLKSDDTRSRELDEGAMLAVLLEKMERLKSDVTRSSGLDEGSTKHPSALHQSEITEFEQSVSEQELGKIDALPDKVNDEIERQLSVLTERMEAKITDQLLSSEQQLRALYNEIERLIPPKTCDVQTPFAEQIEEVTIAAAQQQSYDERLTHLEESFQTSLANQTALFHQVQKQISDISDQRDQMNEEMRSKINEVVDQSTITRAELNARLADIERRHLMTNQRATAGTWVRLMPVGYVIIAFMSFAIVRSIPSLTSSMDLWRPADVAAIPAEIIDQLPSTAVLDCAEDELLPSNSEKTKKESELDAGNDDNPEGGKVDETSDNSAEKLDETDSNRAIDEQKMIEKVNMDLFGEKNKNNGESNWNTDNKEPEIDHFESFSADYSTDGDDYKEV